MTNSLFREKAMKRSVELDAYDTPLELVRPGIVFATTALLVTVMAALAWSLVTDVPVKVRGNGILLSSGGVVDVVSDTQGRLVDLISQPGDRVSAGQPVARVDQADLEAQLGVTQGRLADLVKHKAEVETHNDRDAAARARFSAARRAALQQNLDLAEKRESVLSERERLLRQLMASNTITKERYLQAQAELFTVLDQIAQARGEITNLKLQDTVGEIERERALLDVERQITEARREVETIRSKLGRNAAITSPFSGVVVEAKANVGQVVTMGAPLLTLVRDATLPDGRSDLVAVVYVPPVDGKKISPGMEAEVIPAVVKEEEYGFIRGRVTSVSEVPASTGGMMTTLQNDQLVKAFSGEGGAPYEVRVALDVRPEGRGPVWSSGDGPTFAIRAGTMIEARVNTKKIRVLGLLIPAVQSLLDGDAAP